MPGIGRRLDGWPNRTLDVGKIIALSPALPDDKKAVYNNWGPGKYDPRYNIDGMSTPLVLPPAYGPAKIKNETYTAERPISYWNRLRRGDPNGWPGQPVRSAPGHQRDSYA